MSTSRGRVVSLLALSVSLLALAASGTARAAPAACFPQRYVLVYADLMDEHGRVFGAIRSGQRVRVIDDRVGPDGDWAQVEIEAPSPLSAYVVRTRLMVFAKSAITIEPDFLWWIHGAALNLDSGDSEHALASTAARHDGGPGHAPFKVVSCAEVTAEPPPVSKRSPCYGAYYDSPESPPGQRVAFPHDKFGITDEVVDFRGKGGLDVVPDGFTEELRVLKRQGDKALLEAWFWDAGLRLRQWVPSKLLRPSHQRIPRSMVTECKCCPVRAWQVWGEESHIAGPGAEMRVGEGAMRIRLEGNAKVTAAGRLGDQTFVIYEVRSAPKELATILLYGWVPTTSLLGPDLPELPRAIDGVHLDLGQILPQTKIVAVDRRAQGSPASLPLFVPGKLVGDHAVVIPAFGETLDRIYLRDSDGIGYEVTIGDNHRRKLFAAEALVSLPRDEYHSVELRVRSQDNLLIPNAAIREFEDHREPHGIHRVLVSRETQELSRLHFAIRASGYGPEALNLEKTSAERTIRLRRQRILAGVLPRDANGSCSDWGVTWVDRKGDVAVYPVDSDCSFSIQAGPRAGVLGPSSVGWIPQSVRFNDGSPFDIEKVTAGWQWRRLVPAEEDQCDLVGGDKNLASTRTWLFVRVAIPGKALVDNIIVRAYADRKEVASCRSASGACFLHALPAVPIELRAETPHGQARLDVRPQPGHVTEVTIPLGAI